MRAVSDTTGGFDQPTESVRQLGPEPATMREAQASPEWPYWKNVIKREMDGQTARGAWQAIDRPKGKIVLDTRTVFKGKIDKNGKSKNTSAVLWHRGSGR